MCMQQPMEMDAFGVSLRDNDSKGDKYETQIVLIMISKSKSQRNNHFGSLVGGGRAANDAMGRNDAPVIPLEGFLAPWAKPKVLTYACTGCARAVVEAISDSSARVVWDKGNWVHRPFLVKHPTISSGGSNTTLNRRCVTDLEHRNESRQSGRGWKRPKKRRGKPGGGRVCPLDVVPSLSLPILPRLSFFADGNEKGSERSSHNRADSHSSGHTTGGL